MRDKVPPEVFTTPYTNPVNGNPEAVRANLREATRLLREAGYEIRNRKLVNAKTGEPMTVELLIDRPDWERIVLFYKPSLERLGIQMTVRIVDDAQYENRLRQLGLRHDRARPGASRCRPATSSAASGARRRPTRLGSRNLSASRIRRSTR